MYKVNKVEVLDNYRLALVFNDGTSGAVDLSYLAGRGVFAFWKDYNEFQKVKIGSTGELIWGNNVDLCPDSLYLKVTGKKPEDVFTGIKYQLAHA